MVLRFGFWYLVFNFMNPALKNLIGVAIIIAILVGLYEIGQYVYAYSRSTEPASFRSFVVVGEGKAAVVPDIAKVTVGVITEGGSDIGKLQEANTKKIDSIIEFVKSKKVDVKDITTKAYSIDPKYSQIDCRDKTECPPPKITGYIVRQDVEVKMRDFREIGAILNGVVEKGANSVSQLQFTVDDPTAVEKEAREKAFRQVKAKAEDIAKSGGFGVGRLLSVSEGRGYPPEPIYGFGVGGAKDASQEVRTVIEPGSTEFTVFVTLTYEIE